MTPGEACIGIFARAAQSQPAKGVLLTRLRSYFYSAALPENARISFYDPANADVMIRNTHLRFDFTHADQRKAILNGHSHQLEAELLHAGIDPGTLEHAVHAARSAANDYIESHVDRGQGIIKDNDSDFRNNVANEATLRVARVLGLN